MEASLEGSRNFNLVTTPVLQVVILIWKRPRDFLSWYQYRRLRGEDRLTRNGTYPLQIITGKGRPCCIVVIDVDLHDLSLVHWLVGKGEEYGLERLAIIRAVGC